MVRIVCRMVGMMTMRILVVVVFATLTACVANSDESDRHVPTCDIAVRRLSGEAVVIDIIPSCVGDGWRLDYRMFSSAGGLGVITERDNPCGSTTHVEMLMTGQLPLADLVPTGWIFNDAGTSRTDCTVTAQ